MTKEELECLTFKQLANEWLEYKRPTIKESSFFNYKFTVRTKLVDEFGNKSVNELLSYNFNTFVTKLMDYCSPKTVKDIIIVLKSILRYVETKYDVNFKTSLISMPNSSEKEVEVFKERERKKIERYCIKSEEVKNLGVLISCILV